MTRSVRSTISIALVGFDATGFSPWRLPEAPADCSWSDASRVVTVDVLLIRAVRHSVANVLLMIHFTPQ